MAQAYNIRRIKKRGSTGPSKAHRQVIMSDAKIKVASNPYSKALEFSCWEDGWERIDSSNNPSSKLLDKDIVEGFFPFKAKEIVDRIRSEYQAGNKPITIVFEGSDDEYEELRAVCDEEGLVGSVILERGDRRLSNARDVLPEIVEVFKGVRPLVDESVLEREKIAKELDKFYDVSSDLIPLCVLGNYSSGKSTFINALIGHELLPNGDMPVTAKVFQIRRSKHRDRASIRFELDDQPMELRFNSLGLNNADDLPSGTFRDKILKSLERVDGMIPQMNKVLHLVNGYKAKEGGNGVSDLIAIEVPFCQDDPWALSHEFVIFDTPGSNSASNEDHIRVLKSAMDGLSNGLPIYIAEYSSLDSTDNERLYDEIKRIEAMDERFAMIVVNKADAAELPKGSFGQDDIDQIMDMAIPRNLYAQGVYFVSSILGLGAKTGGEFMSDSYAEKFEDQERKYSNPDNRFYKMLYRYNILPGQIGKRTNLESEKCPNLVFANSGMYCVEQEIVLFAERYSAYNKCHQSESLLRRIIEITSTEIEAKKEDCRNHKEDLEQELEDDKAELLENLAACGEKIEQEGIERYPLEVCESIDASNWFKPLDELIEREAQLTRENQEERGFALESEEARTARKAIGENFGERMSSAISSPSIEAIEGAFKGLANDIREANVKREKAQKTSREADEETSEDLLREVRKEFETTLESIVATVDERSREFWGSCSESGREAIYRLATNNTVLSEEKRKEIADIIIQYPALDLSHDVEDIFTRSKFDGLRVWNILFYQSARLNLNKVSKTFDSEVSRAVDEARERIRESHEISFKQWLGTLIGKVRDNITEYNPVLNRHVRLINEAERRILDLTRKHETLQRCADNVSKMIDWKE